MYRLIITAKEVRGYCEVYKKGDRMVFQDPNLVLDATNKVCIYALNSLLPIITTLCREIADEEDWITSVKYCHCPDPGPAYAGGSGSVIFEIKREKI